MSKPIVEVEAIAAPAVNSTSHATAIATPAASETAKSTETAKPAESTETAETVETAETAETAEAVETPANDDQQTTEHDDVAKNESAATEKSKSDETAENGKQKTPSAGKMLKTKAQINKDDVNANRKFDPSVLPETDDPVKIRTQVRSPMILFKRETC
jgi:lupus La protein